MCQKKPQNPTLLFSQCSLPQTRNWKVKRKCISGRFFIIWTSWDASLMPDFPLLPAFRPAGGAELLKNKSLTQPLASLVAQAVKNLPAMQPTPVISPGKSHGQRSWVGYSPWGRRVRGNCATNILLYQWKPPPFSELSLSSQKCFLQSSLNGLFKMQMRSWQSVVPVVSHHPQSETLTPYFLALSAPFILLCPQGSSCSLNECNCGQKTPG